jgi:Flp pilus assembly protein TadG
MKLSRQQRTTRRGAIAPLTALLMIPLMGMVAFAVDMGLITHTQNELQSAADAAALAGAGKLSSGFVNYYSPGQSSANQTTILDNAKSSAKTAAKNFASYNSAGGVSSLTLLDADITLGFTDSSGNFTPLASGNAVADPSGTGASQATYTGFPNTVKVVMRRDSSANGALGLYFAPVLGISSQSLTATAAATIYTGTINGFNTGTDIKSHILPMTYDVNHWNNFIKTGQGPDGNTDKAANGYPQLDVYPSVKYTGNFGELSLDQATDGSSTISGWIGNGVPASTLQADYTAGLLPLATHNPLGPPNYTTLSPDWLGNSGIKDTTIQAVAPYVGQSFLLPLFKPVNSGSSDLTQYQAGSGQGSNYYYTIVQFVGIQITAVDSTGNNKSIKVEPSAVIDPNAIYSAYTPAAPPTNSSPLVTTFTQPRLTQ